jgi:hypothetical protein
MNAKFLTLIVPGTRMGRNIEINDKFLKGPVDSLAGGGLPCTKFFVKWHILSILKHFSIE